MSAKTQTEFVTAPANWTELKPHPYSQFTDFGTGIDLSQLSEHMRRNGFDGDEAIVLIWHEKKWWILDGRHKHIAAQEAGVVPTFRKFVGDDPLEYVRKKLLRQHLTESQRAAFVAKMNKLPGKSQLCKLAQSLPGESQIATQEERAEIAGVSRRTMADADKVAEHGTEELQEAVLNGTLKVSDAAKVATETPEKQNGAVHKVKKGKAKTVTEAVHKSDCQEDEDDDSAEGQMKAVNHSIESFCRQLMKLVDESCPDDKWLNDRRDAAIQKFKDGCSILRTAKCSHICPKCEGECCTHCRKTGRVPKATYDQLV